LNVVVQECKSEIRGLEDTKVRLSNEVEAYRDKVISLSEHIRILE
jgi:hypothetical protein